MIKDQIDVTSMFISSIVLLLITLIFDDIAIGLLLALLCFPVSKHLATQIHQKRTKKQLNKNPKRKN